MLWSVFLCCVQWNYKWLCAHFFMFSVTSSCSEVVAASTGHWYSVISIKDFCTFVWSFSLNTRTHTNSLYFALINQTTDWPCFKIDVLLSHKLHIYYKHSLHNIWVVWEQRGFKYCISDSVDMWWFTPNQTTFKIHFAS